MLPPSHSTHNDVDAATSSGILHRSLKHLPHRVVGASGNYINLSNGQKILDATGGAAVSCLGHGNPRVKAAVMRQMDEVAYCHSLFFSTGAAESLGKELIESTNGEMAKAFIVSSGGCSPKHSLRKDHREVVTDVDAFFFFSKKVADELSLGSEAIEAAMKLARQFHLEASPPQPGRTRFVARKESYHGTTLGSLSLGGHVGRRALFEPILLQNVSWVSPCNAYRGMKAGESDEEYVARLAKELDDEFQRVGPESVCAFVAEPVVGAVSTRFPRCFLVFVIILLVLTTSVPTAL